MKIIIVGATGTLGKKVAEAFAQKHEIIRVGNTKGDVQVDITNEASIKAMFEQIGAFDALISTSGKGPFAPINQMTGEVFKSGLLDKLLGQVNLVLIGQHYINKGGSFTLTSGILADHPVAAGAALSAVNGGLNSFVLAAAPELENGIRINAVSPNVVEDSPAYFDSFPGEIPVSMEKVVKAYEKSVLGIVTGQVIKVY
ncbi:short chain dehydrogenase [Pedobacter sp. 22163]|uniref:short chain dehydrogenase n=1 Tax=Pedobacter sp. 22163 TaxID=3453883 RepID=UPI003F87097C